MKWLFLFIAFGLCTSQTSSEGHSKEVKLDWYSKGFYEEHRENKKKHQKNRDAYRDEYLPKLQQKLIN